MQRQQHNSMYSARRQRGAVLIVSMILLLVMTVLALGASQITRSDQRMAASTRNHDLAFQAAEAGLRAGERNVDAFVSAPTTCGGPPCTVYAAGSLTAVLNLTYEDQAFRDRAWWTANAVTYAGADTISGEGMAAQEPQYYIEEIEEVQDTLSITPTGPPPSRIYYRITSRAEGGSNAALVVLQSTFARRFN